MLHSRVGPQPCLCQWLCKQTEWELLTKQRSCAEIPAGGVKRLSARRGVRGGALEMRSTHARTRNIQAACRVGGGEEGRREGAESARNLGSFT